MDVVRPASPACPCLAPHHPPALPKSAFSVLSDHASLRSTNIAWTWCSKPHCLAPLQPSLSLQQPLLNLQQPLLSLQQAALLHQHGLVTHLQETRHGMKLQPQIVR